MASCTAKVTISDPINPNAICQDASVALDASGNGSITVADIDNGSNDNCGIKSRVLDITAFDCNDIPEKTVTLTITDDHNNVASCTAKVSISDPIAPNAICQDASVALDASGNGSITVADIDNGSNDNCGIKSRVLDITAFTCSDIPTKIVTLTITDDHNNVASCTAKVTISDPIAPNAICQDASVALDASGNGSITVADIDNGSND
ncbi:MAG: hypothetical protein AB8F95_04420, partial [Bacteroidia bacterium]